MAHALTERNVLVDAFGPTEGAAKLAKQAVLVVVGVLALAVLAKIKIPMWPVAISMGTFAVLTIGAAYGPKLGFATIAAYMLVGVAGFDVFQNSSAENYGWAYMTAGSGGYLLGYVFAIMVMGFAAKAGWDRSWGKMALAMLVANAVIYIPGILWLGQFYGWENPILAWGLWPFLIGDAAKLIAAAILVPAVWKLIGDARA